MTRAFAGVTFIWLWLGSEPLFAAKRSIAVLPVIVTDPADQRRADAFNSPLVEELQRAARAKVELLWGPRLERLLGDRPEAALERCGGHPRCAAQLGHKALVDEVLIATLTNVGHSLQLLIVVVEAESAQISRTLMAQVSTPASLKSSSLRAKLEQAIAAGDEATSEDLLPVPLEAEGPLADGGEPSSAPASEPASAPVVMAPAPPLQPRAPLLAASPLTGTLHDGVSARLRRPLAIAGFTTLATSAVAAGIATSFALHFLLTPRAAPSGVSQVAYAEQVAAANRSAIAADVAFGVAALLGGAGVTMILVEVLRRAPARTR